MSPTTTLAGLVTLAAAAPLAVWFAARRYEEVPCTLDLESTPEQFHAHAIITATHVNEGDEVRVHNAPSRIAIGEVRRIETSATVAHASAPRRWWTRVIGVSEISSLYEVGFEG
jgi:hypothetical protein